MAVGQSPDFCVVSGGRGGVGNNRTGLSLFGHLAAHHQHRHDDPHLPHGVSNPKYAERDALAVQVKLDELVRAVANANNQLVGIEKLTETEVRSLHDKVIDDAAREDASARFDVSSA
jgi:hypothetical protein